ncbi:MAG: hypothetical protein IKV76_03650 [Clostridia bacterium]|nr:hypothetical protein [Clostridia bacterium]
MKLAKKSLSIFLALLMLFSCCSVGLTGIVASAAEGDSEYSKQEVADLINAATAGGFTLSSSNNEWNYTADDGKALAAARAIFDYAVNTYREGKEANSAYNSTKGLYDKFDADFNSMYTNATAARRLVKNVLDPDGTAVYSYENKATKSQKLSESETEYTKGTDVTGTFPVTSYPGYYGASTTSVITKKASVQLDLNKYLATFSKIEDIPSTIITSVTYTYAHTYSSTATVSDVTSRTEGSGCSAKTYYTPTISTTYWNYMTAKPVKLELKDKTIRKTLLTLEKYFNEELFATTKADMLAMNVEDIKSLYLTTEMMYATLFTDDTLTTKKFSDATLSHFGLAPAKIEQFMKDVDFAYRAVAGKHNIDILNTLIGTEYNVESYAEMSELYAKTSTAYDVVYNMDAEIINYIVGEGGYAEQYESAMALKATAESYNAVLFDIMTEQKLEETVEAMVATYTDYINVLNKEDIENPSDAEVIGLVQKVEAFDAIIASYTGYSYYRTYWTTDYEASWKTFSEKLNEVYEVRGLKMEFQTYYSYFLPLIYTTQIDTLDNASAISLHADLDTKITELRDSYNSVVAKWGGTIADKIFTVVYEESPYLLQTLVDSVKSTGKEAVKTVLIARTEAALDAVYAYKDTTVVNFDNFASIKSTLTYFDYDLYNYVNGGGEGQNSWLSTDYTNKYAMVQTLLDRYHAFSTTDGKAFFNENFTYADANGVYATRYAGSQFDADGNQIGYPADIARNGSADNYVVTEEKLLATVAKIDSFITSRDFGAIAGFVDADDEDVYVALDKYVEQMLNEMLFNDQMMNTLVGAIFPMVVDLIGTELIGAISNLGGDEPVTPRDPNASAAIDVGAMSSDLKGSGIADLYIDEDTYNGKRYQNYLSQAFADLGLMIYPSTFADSLLMANPVNFGVGTPIYEALKAADRDWTKLVCADDPETEMIDETKVLEFEWGVYDQESFLETLSCVLEPLLPLLQTALCGASYNESASNAAYATINKITYNLGGFLPISVSDVAANGDIVLSIAPLNLYSSVIVPLFHVLGIQDVPTLRTNASADQIVKAIFGTLLNRVEEIIESPLTSILDILPNLVYFLSMDSVQEIINGLVITLNIAFELEIDSSNSGDLAKILGAINIEGLINDMLKFDLDLNLADMIDLYDMLGVEISDFNEVLNKLLIPMLGIEGLELPPMRQQDIIFCSDWSTFSDGSVNLVANEGDLIYWFLNYVVSALVPDENGNSLLTALLGADMDPTIKGIIDKVINQITGNQNGALAAIIELLNPTTYDLEDMDWLENTYNYNGIEGSEQMSIVYLNYGNDWTKDKSQYLLDNADALIASILEMTGAEAMDLGAMLQDTVNGLFTNANITELVKMLGGLGDSPSAIIADIVGQQVGIDLGSWFTAFGYLYPAETWAEDAEIIPVDHRTYVNNFGVEGIANEDGTITWSFNKMPLNDGDGYTFINILTRLLGGADVLVKFLFAGEDVSAFNGLLTIKGYETYATTFGLLLEMLGVENIPTQADFNADAMGSFSNMLMAALDWFYALTSSDDMIAQLVELIPDLFYFIESNGLSTFLHNLLMPVLVIVDTVRPLINVDINGVLSLVVSEFINYGTLDVNVILEYIIHGIYMNEDVDFVWYNVDLFNLTLSEIIKIVDGLLGTNLYNSGFVNVGIKGFCSGLEKVENTAVGTVYKPSIDAADTMTILVTALLDCLDYPAADATKTNGDAIFALVAELTENEDIAGLYPVIAEVIKGVEVEYTEPNWGYMFENADDFSLTLPEQSIVYLGYTTDWTKDTADTVYDALDDILEMILPSVLPEGETLSTLIYGLLEDNVYSDEILNTIVELIANAIGTLDETLRDTIDVALATDIASWFAMCEETVDEEGNTVFVCTKDWGIDAADAADKKDLFVAGLKEVLTPANSLLALIFFGEELALFTGSEKNDAGEYVYNDIIKLNGGEGYARGLAPILEALGCELAPASAYYDAATGTYNVADAVEGIINSVFALVDTITANPVEEVFKLLPNLIYFINADGLVSSVNNLLAPIDGLIEKLSPIISEDGSAVSIGGLLEPMIGLNISNLSTETLLGIAADAGVKISPEMLDIICNLYVGKLVEFDSVSGLKGYRLDVTGAEGDVLTIVLSLALDLFNLNNELFSDLLGAETYAAVVTLIKGLDIDMNYIDVDWAYMYEGDFDKLNTAGFPEQSIVYLGYTTDWTPAVADSVYGVLDEVLALVLDATLEDGANIKTLIEGLLNDNVYSDEVLTSLVELIVNGLANLDAAIYEAAGAVLDADIAAWFSMCEPNADGEYVCTKDWGVDEAADKKAAFVAGIKEVLAPANTLLSWLFFGEQYTLFNGTTNEVLVTINGGQGYAYGLLPIFEALGCTMQPAEAFKNADGTYNVGNAVESILDAALALVDEISGNAVAEVFELLPNLIYFINAGGLKAAVNNLLAPANAVITCLNPVIGDFSIGAALTDLAGFDICNITVDTLLKLAADNGVVINDEMAYVLKNLYVGAPVAYESANGKTAYRVDITGHENDILTIVLGLALDLFKTNKELFAPLMGEEIYDSIVTLIAGAVADFTYIAPDWAYMYEGEDALAQLVANGLPERTEENSYVYLQYTNNWNRETAVYLDDVLFDLIKGITEDARDDGHTVGTLLDDAITRGLYKNSILNSLIEMVVGFMIDYEEIIKGAGALLGAESIANWFEYCEVTVDENGNKTVTCTHDWGIDSAVGNEAKRNAFVEGFVTALEPAYQLLAWLLFGEDYTFFNGTTSEVLITIKGGNGYAEAFVPLLEALGCTMGADTDSGIKAPADFYVDGKLDMEMATRDIFGALAGWLHEICGDMSTGSIDVMLDKLPNVVYFINAGGLKAVVNNLLQPVNFILEALKPMGVNVDFSTLISGFDITNIDFYAIFNLIEDLVPLYFPDEVQKFVAEFYMGETVAFTSANGQQAFRMQYTDAESRADMITVLISLVLESAQDPRNEAKLSDWLGEDIFWAIMNVLRIEKCKDMENYAWILTEHANTGKKFSSMTTSENYATYNEYWTKDKAQDLAENFEVLLGNVLDLIGLEVNGTVTRDVEDLLNVVISSNLYTQDMADTILNAVKDLLSNLTGLEPYGEYIIDVLNTAFGVDLTVYETMTLTVAEGSREDFEAALGQIIAPIVPLLEVILCGENISLFYELDGSETIVLYGSEGYAYGIIPVMEALGCTMPTPAEFEEIMKNDPDAAIKCITTPLLDRVDKIVADPITGLTEILSSAMYFINSNGLETAFTNLVAAVDTVLAGLEGVVGSTSLAELLDIDLSEFNAEYITTLVADLLSDATGMDFAPVVANLVAELTFGEVVTYDSANGETYYTMKATEADKADMTTAILRMAIDFITTEDNLESIKALLADSITNETAYNSVCSLLDTLAGYVAEDPGMSMAMSFIYAVCIAATEASEEIDDTYHDVNNSWMFILKLFSTSEEPLLRDFAEELKSALNENFDGIFTEEGVAPDGALTFFDKLKAFFERIAEFFRNLFGM